MTKGLKECQDQAQLGLSNWEPNIKYLISSGWAFLQGRCISNDVSFLNLGKRPPQQQLLLRAIQDLKILQKQGITVNISLKKVPSIQLEGKKYQNNFQDHGFSRLLKFPALLSVLNRQEKRAENFKKPGKIVVLKVVLMYFFLQRRKNQNI